MSGISAMFFGGTSFVFAGAWDFFSVFGTQSYGAGLALGSDGTSPYVVLGGYTSTTLYASEGRVFRVNTDRTTAWTRSVDNPSSGGATAVAVALDTSYNTFFANNTQDNVGTNLGPVLVKTDTSGVVSWQRNLTTGSLLARAVATDSSGNVYIAGTNDSDTVGFLAKYNSSGTLQWQRTLASDSQCAIQSIAVDGSGNVIVAGYYKFSGANRYAHITKYNSSGTLQWQKYVNQTATNYTANIPAMVCDGSDNIYFYMSTGAFPGNSYNYYIKLDSTGAMQWTRRTDNNNDYATGGAYIDADGYIYFVAYHGVSTNGTYIVKYNSSGTRQFDRKLTNVTSPRGIVVDTAGFMWVQGNTTDGTDVFTFLTRLPSDGPGSLTFSLPTPAGPITVATSTPALTENTTALTIATSSLTDAAGTYTDSAGALTTSTFSTTAYTSTG